MSNEDPERLAKILVLFFQQFRGVSLGQDSFTKDFGFDNAIKVRFTMEHEDLELPPKLEKSLRLAVNQTDLAQIDEHIREVCRLVDLYRHLFSGSDSGPERSENSDLIKNSLKEFTRDFKDTLASAMLDQAAA